MNLFIIPLIGLIIFLVLFLLVIWIWAIVDCIKSDLSGEYKLFWLLIIIFLNIIGAALYFFLADNMRSRNISIKGKKGKYLMRSSDNKIIGGVCGGIAEHFSFDPAIIRILWVVFTIFVNGVGVLLYIIAWVAIPSDKKVKDKNQVKEMKPKIPNKSEKIKPNRRRVFANIFSIIFAIVVVISIIGFVIASQFASHFNYEDVHQISVKNLVVDVRTNVSEKIVIDEIMKSHNYQNLDGQNLYLIEVREPADDSCVIFERDPYGLRIYDSGCREFVHKFYVESEIIKGYDVNTLTSGGRILKMTFTSFIEDVQDINLEKVDCLPNQREVDMCVEVYDPVCGFETDSLNRTFSNACFACMNPNISYWIEGECR